MKNTLAILLICFGWIANSQSIIYQKQGKIEAKHIDIHRKRSMIKADVAGKHIKIKTDAIDSLHIGNQVFGSFLDGKKKRLYAVLATSGTKTLAVSKTDAVKSRGGFESIQSNYELVIAASGSVLKKLNFSNSATSSEVERRAKIVPFIETEFSGCQRLLDHFMLFQNESDKAQLTILNYFDAPQPLKCD